MNNEMRRSPEEDHEKAMFWEGRLMDVLAGEQEADVRVIQKNLGEIVEVMKKEGGRYRRKVLIGFVIVHRRSSGTQKIEKNSRIC